MDTLTAPRLRTEDAAARPAAPRLDLYADIHKALRHAMSHTLLQLGSVDADDPRELQRTLAATEALLAAMRQHLRHENDFIHTAIEARRPAGARRTADDHLEHLGEIAALEAELRSLRAAEPAQRPARVLRLYRDLAVFVAENLQHMHVEETANNAALWALYTDAELAALHDRLVASIPPEEMMGWLRWMAPALSPQSLAAMLADMRAKAPPAAFAAVLDTMRLHVEPGRWVRLMAGLGLSAAGR